MQKLPSGLSFGHINLRGLPNKIDYIRILLRNCAFDVFAITESHLDDSIDDTEIAVQGYRLFRKDRNRHGGGVATYVRDSIESTNCTSPDLQLEMLCLKIKQKNSMPIMCATVYRPPSEHVEWYTQFEQEVEKLSTENDILVFLGDFNVDELKSNRLKDLMVLYGLSQQISSPTRITKDSSTLIDHIYTTDSFGSQKSGVMPFGCSDHHLIYTVRCCFRKKHKEHSTIQYRKFKDVDLQELSTDMDKVPWSCIEAFDDVDDVWSTFRNLFFDVIDRHAPMREKRVKASPAAWINDSILNEMHHRDYLHLKAIRTKEEADWTLFKAARNRVIAKIKQGKRDYLDEAILSSHSSKETWKRIKEFLPSSRSNGPATINTEGSSISDKLQIANTFNNFFSSIGSQIGEAFDNSLPNIDMFATDSPYSIPRLSPEFVKEQIKGMSSTKATGLDGISVKLLKCAGDYIIMPLTYLFNLCITKGKFPTE